MRNCLNCVHNCDDHSSLNLMSFILHLSAVLAHIHMRLVGHFVCSIDQLAGQIKLV